MNFPPIEFHKFSKFKPLRTIKFKNNDKGRKSAIKNLNLNKMVSFLIPDVEISKDLTTILTGFYYEVESFNIADLFAKNTLDGYINTGDFYCMSTGSYSNIRFTLSEKKVSIEVDTDLLHSIGAVHLTKFQKERNDQFHRFEVDLSYAHLDKIKLELTSDLIDRTNVNVAWHPTSQEICPSSVAKYFTDMGYIVNAHKYQTKFDPKYGLKMPIVPLESDDEEITNFSEHLGMILLGCDMTDVKDELNDVGQGKVVHFKGFITHNQLDELIKELQKILCENTSFPYIALSIIPQFSTSNCHPRTVIINTNEFIILQ